MRVPFYFLLLTEAVSKGCENCKKSTICHFYLNHDLRMGCELLSTFGADKDVSKGCKNCKKSNICHLYLKL